MIIGSAWITKDAFGCKNRKLKGTYANFKSLYNRLQPQIVKYPVENFFRFDPASKFTVLSIALALYDAKMDYSAGEKQEIALLGTNSEGALPANLAYFQDYVSNGRTLGRGNLFIYTLPSSPLAEAAIHFALTGELLYLDFGSNTEKKSLQYALNMLKAGPVKTILLVNSDPKKTVCTVIRKPNYRD